MMALGPYGSVPVPVVVPRLFLQWAPGGAGAPQETAARESVAVGKRPTGRPPVGARRGSKAVEAVQ